MNNESVEIVELRKKIEESVGRVMHTPADFDFLSGAIWERIREYISPTTLKRTWGYLDGVKNIRFSTLETLPVSPDSKVGTTIWLKGGLHRNRTPQLFQKASSRRLGWRRVMSWRWNGNRTGECGLGISEAAGSKLWSPSTRILMSETRPR